MVHLQLIIANYAFRMADSELFKEYAFWASLLVGKGWFTLSLVVKF